MVQESRIPHSPLPPNIHFSASICRNQADAQAMEGAKRKLERALALRRQGQGCYTEAECVYFEALQTILPSVAKTISLLQLPGTP
ncbi:hypothetical protein NP233_g6204 [Leucocoprinus birnbaumii]|uniref:Uncharacterized protein n=1 Tax=Leucocoprinus birnbaumii TaxID=56174 RepID=A0AAD5VSM4_9AGAR|nr:hypothetical protein NP233_g6204 [Leucocoprinus birnbaumii]